MNLLNERQNLHFQTIINASPDIVVLKDAEGRWVEASKKTQEIFGLDEDKYKGRTDLELGKMYPPYQKYVPSFLQTDHQAWTSGKEIRAEETIVIDGEEHTFDVVKVPIYDSEGNRDSIVVIGRDISELLRSEQQYKTLFYDHPDGAYSLDTNGNFLAVNEMAEKISGYKSQELLKMNFRSLISPEKLHEQITRFEQVLKGESRGQVTKLIRKDGQIRDVQTTTIPAILNGKVISITGIARDVTDKIRLESLQEKQTKILSKIAMGEPLSDILNNIIETVETLSNGICSIMYYEKEHNWLRFGYGPRLDKRFIKKIDKFPVGLNFASCGHAAYTKELTIVTNIETHPSWSKWSKDAITSGFRSCWSIPILNPKNELLGTFAVYDRKIREPEDFDIHLLNVLSYLTGLALNRNKQEQEIKYLAHHDILTNLPNIRYLKDIFSEIVQQSSKLAVMFLDLDKFKTLNDTFGHDLGDKVIQEISKRIQKNTGENTITSRFGGDEFVILIRDISTWETAHSIAKHLLSEIEKPLVIMNREHHVTASIGISMYPDHGETLEDLMKNADVAMYSVKDIGGNSSRVYEVEMNEKAYESYMLQGEFRKALEQNQFELYYQPKIDIKTGLITGVEALVRWKHPLKGYISPSIFIPLAEESDFILDLGEWVLREACRQLKTWKEIGVLDIRVAVNVSVKQFIKQDVVGLVKDTLKKFSLSPNCLEIEITESVLSSHESLIEKSIAELQRIGVKISIDDFGTGYASLTYLKQFRANTIKIDRTFIHQLPESIEDAAIVTAVISLANDLKINVIAEGVETVEQLDFLKEKGCSEVQGYYYSAPLPPEEIYPMMNKYK